MSREAGADSSGVIGAEDLRRRDPRIDEWRELLHEEMREQVENGEEGVWHAIESAGAGLALYGEDFLDSETQATLIQLGEESLGTLRTIAAERDGEKYLENPFYLSRLIDGMPALRSIGGGDWQSSEEEDAVREHISTKLAEQAREAWQEIQRTGKEAKRRNLASGDTAVFVRSPQNTVQQIEFARRGANARLLFDIDPFEDVAKMIESFGFGDDEPLGLVTAQTFEELVRESAARDLDHNLEGQRLPGNARVMASRAMVHNALERA